MDVSVKRLIISILLLLIYSSSIMAQGNLSAAVTPSSATLTWTASTTSGVNYHVYKATVAAGPFKLISTLAATTVIDYLVVPGHTYIYYVTSYCLTKGC